MEIPVACPLRCSHPIWTTKIVSWTHCLSLQHILFWLCVLMMVQCSLAFDSPFIRPISRSQLQALMCLLFNICPPPPLFQSIILLWTLASLPWTFGHSGSLLLCQLGCISLAVHLMYLMFTLIPLHSLQTLCFHVQNKQGGCHFRWQKSLLKRWSLKMILVFNYVLLHSLAFCTFPDSTCQSKHCGDCNYPPWIFCWFSLLFSLSVQQL